MRMGLHIADLLAHALLEFCIIVLRAWCEFWLNDKNACKPAGRSSAFEKRLKFLLSRPTAEAITRITHIIQGRHQFIPVQLCTEFGFGLFSWLFHVAG